MPRRYARINCNGIIHDDDSADWFGDDEEEPFSWSTNLTLEDGGFSRRWSRSYTVDGEVQLRMKIRFQSAKNGVISLSGTIELREGGVYWTTEVSRPIDHDLIEPGETKIILQEKLEGDGGDWADVTFEVTNDPIP